MPSTTPFQKLTTHLDPDQIEEARQDAVRQQLEYTLGELRKVRHVTQAELARVLGMTQPSVSQIEQRDDVRLSTIKDYIEGLGGRLELVAVFGDKESFTLAC